MKEIKSSPMLFIVTLLLFVIVLQNAGVIPCFKPNKVDVFTVNGKGFYPSTSKYAYLPIEGSVNVDDWSAGSIGVSVDNWNAGDIDVNVNN